MSGRKQNNLHRIRFTLKPNFGFLFTIEGKFKYHFCWELLNSHATYLWSIPYAVKNNIEIVEQNINLINSMGRQNYKNELGNNNSFLPISVDFNLIRHSNNNNGFYEWKNQLNSITV